MICDRCKTILRKPLAVLGAQWLWKCACDWQVIAPAQYARGLVVSGSDRRRVIEASGVIDA